MSFKSNVSKNIVESSIYVHSYQAPDVNGLRYF